MDWSKTAFLFPGQGSQHVGMGKELAESYPVVKETFAKSDEILGFSLSDLCWNGPEEKLNDTLNTQPAIFTCSIAILRALQSKHPEAQPAFVAGHSLGEFSALTAAGALDFEDSVRLVRERGRLMKEAGEKSPGAMAAILALDADTIREIASQVSDETGEVLVLANDNCPGQIVISGSGKAIDTALPIAQERGAKRAVKLDVSIAAHSPLMESASEEFRQLLNETNFHVPAVPIYGNVSTTPLTTIEEIRQELDVQLTQSVRWTESMQNILEAGAEIFVEVGPKDVLTGLMKRIQRSSKRYSLNDLSTLDDFLSNSE